MQKQQQDHQRAFAEMSNNLCADVAAIAQLYQYASNVPEDGDWVKTTGSTLVNCLVEQVYWLIGEILPGPESRVNGSLKKSNDLPAQRLSCGI